MVRGEDIPNDEFLIATTTIHSLFGPLPAIRATILPVDSSGGRYLAPEQFYRSGPGATIMMSVVRKELPDLLDGDTLVVYPSLYRQWAKFYKETNN